MMLPILRPATKASIGTPRVLQFGDGVFIRAFIGHLFQSLRDQGIFHGSILPIKARSGTPASAYQDQQGWFTVLERGIVAGKEWEASTVIRLYEKPLQPDAAPDAFLATASWPDLNIIVSNTTEAGLSIGEKDTFAEACQGSFPAKLTRWLYARFEHFQGARDAAVSVLPLELLPDNGKLLQSLCLKLAHRWQLPDTFIIWLEQCRFYNSLVDRIVSGFPKENYETIWKSLGYEDRLLVVAEPFFSWVIEVPKGDRSLDWLTQSAKRVVLTDRLEPYRECKLRLLNAPHTAMVSLGLLSGLQNVRQCMINPRIGHIIEQLMRQELLLIPMLPQPYALQFMSEVVDRFANPFLHHKLESIALNSTTKIKSRLLPALDAFPVNARTRPTRMYQTLAAWVYLLISGQSTEHMAEDAHRADLQEFRISWHADADPDFTQLVLMFFQKVLDYSLADHHVQAIASELEALDDAGFDTWLKERN